MIALDDVPFDHAVGLLSGGALCAAHGDLSARRPLASVTKLVTAWSCLVAVDRGLLGLDDPAGPEGSTIRHLLAHASGLPVDAEEPQAAPGKRRIYSNAGYDLLGRVLFEATGAPVGRWIEETVLEPLGMSATEVPGSPARSGVGTVEDLLVFGAEMLDPRLIRPETAAEAMRAQFSDLAGVVPGYGRQSPCPWGLGPEIKGGKSPHWMAPGASPETVGHFGVSGSFLWADPTRGACAAFLGEEPFGAWHREHWSRLNAALVDIVDGA
ncbi:beta-lactamase family protein [Actinomyces sp. B33]|uniref:serine hydrolase domain-containing protein n=1 Tax=Actinomyces sp. B33 TaxID=2942131 RepID=UPI002341BA94|nr:serine hydrolase domain-containing protein [Actinomyces sp. B33]MDC4232254.1 beta-lactamase family protein [Actinomyces sp. B33]